MGWIDRKHEASEEKAISKQFEEYSKIQDRKLEIATELNFTIEKEFDFENIYEFDTLYLSDEKESTDYMTDTYRLAKPIKRKGYIYKVTYLSESLYDKYKLRFPSNKIVLKTPNVSQYGVPSIEAKLLKLLEYNIDFYCINSITNIVEVTLRDLYDKDLSGNYIDDIAPRYNLLKIMKLYGNNDKQYKTFEDFHTAYQAERKRYNEIGSKQYFYEPIGEIDNGEVKVIYYMVPVI